MCNGLHLDFINIDACTKFDKNPPINQDIEHKQILMLIKDHNSIEN